MEPTLPPITETERTPLVEELLATIDADQDRIHHLEADKKHLEDKYKHLEADKKHLEAELDRFKKRLAQYEPEVWYEGKPKSSETRTPSASYSLDAEEKRRRHGQTRPKKSPGRRPTEVKFANAPVYDRFTRSQKCWAHLLRKLIRLAVLYPRKKRYRRLLDDLLTLYRDAKRAAADERLDEAGRKRCKAEFEDRLCRLWKPYWPYEVTSELPPHERDFGRFINEVMDLCLAEELFTFVLVKGVESTNNTVERLLRNSALDHKAGRTNKTAAGAHRRSAIVSVLESLRANLKQFTLTSVLEEAALWMREGISLFAKQWQKICGDEPVPHFSFEPNTS